jgi:uncharacterized spore protein YtfJ
MSIDRLFESVERAKEAAHWRSAFGEPQVVGDKTIIPVARVRYGFGTGFGSGQGPETEDQKPTGQGEGGGGGGMGSAQPLGVLVVTPEDVYFEETAEETKIAMAGVVLAGVVIWQLAKTLRAIFGK